MTDYSTGHWVLGIDPSLTATGLSWIDAEATTVGVQTLRSTGHNNDTLAQRSARIDTLAQGFQSTLEHLGVIDLAVIEGPSHGSKGGSAWDRAGLWWAYVSILFDRGIQVAVCVPTTRIKWATGSGKATKSTKSDVAVAAVRLWPDVSADGDNEWDALCLATIGAQRLGWPVPHRAHHVHAQTAIVWPELLPVATPVIDLEAS